MHSINVHFQSTIEINEEDIDVEVEANVDLGYAGTYFDPPEGPEAEIVNVEGPNGDIEINDIDMGDMDKLENQAIEEARNQI
jgi:hypothetical protein